MGKKRRDATAAWRARAASEAPLDVYNLTPAPAEPPIPDSSKPWDILELAIKRMIPDFEANPSYGSTTRRMRELEAIFASTKNVIDINYISTTVPATTTTTASAMV